MKSFIKRIKAKLLSIAAWTALIAVTLLVIIVHPFYVAYSYVTTKVRGAISWIANKYNSFITSAKTAVEA